LLHGSLVASSCRSLPH